MQRFKIYEDTENLKPAKRAKVERNQRKVLGEIKNVIVTRSKSSQGIKNINDSTTFKKEIIQNRSKIPLPKKPLSKPNNNKILEEKSKTNLRKNQDRRLSSIFNVTDYATDIYKYLVYLEEKFKIPESLILEIQERFDECTRFTLLDWYVEIHEFAEMSSDTFQLSVTIMDQYIQNDKSIRRKQLQLVSLAAAFIASKYEEVNPIEVDDLIYVSDNSYTLKEIYAMEIKIIKALNFNFGMPTALNFIRRYTLVRKASRIEQSLAMYFSDVALLSYQLCYIKPSIIACTAFYIALYVLREDESSQLWDPSLIACSGYKYRDFEELVPKLAALVIRVSKTNKEALRRKYSHSKYQSVSLMPCLTLTTGSINKLIKRSPS